MISQNIHSFRQISPNRNLPESMCLPDCGHSDYSLNRTRLRIAEYTDDWGTYAKLKSACRNEVYIPAIPTIVPLVF